MCGVCVWCMCIGEHICPCVSVGAWGWDNLLNHFSNTLVGTGSPLTWMYQSYYTGKANELQGFSCLTPPARGYRCLSHTHFSDECQGSELRSSWLHSRYFTHWAIYPASRHTFSFNIFFLILSYLCSHGEPLLLNLIFKLTYLFIPTCYD